jgi:N-acetylmuramic acid 6-phosphate etherase
MNRITEKDSLYNGLENMSTIELVQGINQEDQKVARAIEKILPEISLFIDEASSKMQKGGRLFYLGAGTSGRLGIVDASECPPTFGVEHGLVVGIIAGGDQAIRKAVEFAEDNETQGWKDLEAYQINENDIVVGIAASGTTPYVLGALKEANSRNILTAGITCNPGSPLASIPKHGLVAEVGPEFITGSTRMKSGTAQKLILNMISTSLMIKLGRVKGNKMVDMQLSNVKLIDRGTRMIMNEIGIEETQAAQLLKEFGSVRNAVDNYLKKNQNQ